jgi:hypothetical protein
MKYRLLIGLFFLIFLFLNTAVRADTIYTYTGNPFNAFRGSYTCPPQCRITGSFTVAQPVTATFGGPVVPLSYDFTDGFTHWTNSNSVVDNSFRSWSFSDPATCRFYCWFIALVQPGDLSYPRRGIATFDGGADVSSIQTSPNTVTDFAWNYDLRGTWSVSLPVPEPSSLFLLGAGLLGAGLFLRRKQTV